jgi:Carboxypeptidase regulatory-like domain
MLSGIACLAAGATSVQAQSLTSGSLRGEVRGSDGVAIIGAQITITDRITGNTSSFPADRRGRFNVALALPGLYSVTADQAGYQPVRQTGVRIGPGEETFVLFTLERRPPPIEAVVEIPADNRSALSRLRGVGEEVAGMPLQTFDFQQDITGISRNVSNLVYAGDGRRGFGLATGGLPPAFSRLYVDAMEQNLLHHPGVPGEPVQAPLFSRNSLSGASALDDVFDSEWDGIGGALLSGRSRVGSSRLAFNPYLTYSGSSIGGRSEDNPADLSASSIQAGAVLSGSLVRDTSHFVLGLNYQSLEQPTANPWEQDSALFDGSPVSLREVLPIIAADSFATDVSDFTTPTVRSWRGFNTFGRIDWQLSRNFGFFVRAGLAKWKEQDAQLGISLPSGFGTRLEAKDFSAAVGLASTWTSMANEFRVGVRTSSRDWLTSRVPTTVLVSEGAGFGAIETGPANFDQRGFDINEAFQYSLGRHRFKAGFGLGFNKWSQDYVYGRRGIFRFGDVDGFSQGAGTFFQVVSTGSADIATTDLEAFLQDLWSVTPDLQVQLGVRYEKQGLPSDKIEANAAWVNASGILYNLDPEDKNNVSPRLGFVWDVQNRGEWVVRGGGGLYYSKMDLALFSEAALFDGDAVVRRGLGTFAAWPGSPDSVAAPVVGQRLALFDDEYQDPRTAKIDLALSHSVRGVTLEVSGSYHHTDYLPRRTDLNLLPSATGQTQEGRNIFGTLVKQGGLVSADPGSNRRFSGFDLVSGIVSSGFSDYYGLTASIGRAVEQGLSFRAAYTFSRTSDNWMLGRTGDPVDQLSPFQDDGSDDWTDGRSDLDVPHRLVIHSGYSFPGRSGLELGVRYRYRSGLPFTPGFRSGVDLNADGSGENDPAFIDDAIAGVPELIGDHECLSSQVGEFAERNSCREEGVHALDLHLGIRLPFAIMGSDVRIMLDAFNLVSSETGVVDRALYLVDPSQPLVVLAGDVTVPLIANPNFGSLLVRRGEPRLVRLGLKVDY